MKIEELKNWTAEQLEEDINEGGKFVIYTYVISIIIMTFRRPSDEVYYISSKEHTIQHGWSYLLLSIFFGWWGIPYGILYTIQAIWYAFVGKDVTDEVKFDVLQSLRCATGENTPTYDIEMLKNMIEESPDFITFLRHHIAHNDNQRVT